MNKQTLRAQYIRYLLPSIASLVCLSCYILADTFFVANGVGSIGLTGLNIALPFYSVINALGLMIGIGAGVVVGISRGQGDHQAANRTFQTALLLSGLTGVVLTVTGTVFAEQIAQLLGASEQSLPYAATYIRTVSGFAVFFLLNNTLVALVRNDCNPRLAMVSMVTCSMSNIVLDYIFIIPMGLGMWGAAFATGLAPIIGMAILSLHWVGGQSSLRLERKRPSLRWVPGILRGGVSNLVTELGNGLVILLFNFTLMRMTGDIGVAAYGIVANVALVISYVFIGIGQGTQPLVSQYYGQGNPAACRKLLRMALVLSALIGAAFFLVGQLFPVSITALFNSENDPQLAGITIRAIRIYFVSFLFMGLNITACSYFQSVLRARAATAISLLRAFLLIVAGVAILPGWLGIDGVWLITPISEAVTLLVSAACLLADRLPPRKTASLENSPA